MQGFDLGFAPESEGGGSHKSEKRKKKKSKSDDAWDDDFSDGRGSVPPSHGDGTGHAFPGVHRVVSFSEDPPHVQGGVAGPTSPHYADHGGGTPSHPSGHTADPSFADRFADLSVHSAGNAHRTVLGAAPPPSALEEALARVAAMRASDSSAQLHAVRAAGPADRSSARLGAPGHFDGGTGGSLPTGNGFERRFSFSFSDMPDLRAINGSTGRTYIGSAPPKYDHLPAQRWNPLDGINRHWVETQTEALAFPAPPPLPKGGRAAASLLAPGSMEADLMRTEGRIKEIRSKISSLEADLVPGRRSTSGHVRIIISQPLEGGKLGLTVKDMTVVEIADPRAAHHGWMVGDRILQVNGVPVQSTAEFSAEVAKAMAAHQKAGVPVAFDVWRQVSGPSPGGALGEPTSRSPYQSGATQSHASSKPGAPGRRRTICGEDEAEVPSLGPPQTYWVGVSPLQGYGATTGPPAGSRYATYAHSPGPMSIVLSPAAGQPASTWAEPERHVQSAAAAPTSASATRRRQIGC